MGSQHTENKETVRRIAASLQCVVSLQSFISHLAASGRGKVLKVLKPDVSSDAPQSEFVLSEVH